MNKLLIFILFLLPQTLVYSQEIYKSSNFDIYDFLESMHYKGLVDFNSEVRPINKIFVAELILKVDSQKEKLDELEYDLLKKYKIYFEPELKILTDSVNAAYSNFIRINNRLRLFEYFSKDFSFYADPVFEFGIGSYYDKSLLIRRNGFSISGYVLDNWSYYLNFFDNEERGDNLDKSKRFTRLSGISLTKEKQRAFEYDEVTAGITYFWSNGSVSISKDYLSFGSGNFGKVILSDKAPSFPFIRFDYKPVNWLGFFYFHGFLQSNVPDSNTFRYNSVPGRTSLLEVPKFIAFHSLSFYPTDEISFSLGESIIYSERLQPVYFIPVMFFRVADHYLGTDNASATGNAQLFSDLSYLNRAIKTKFYFSLFIDELSLNNLFEGKNLSAIGFTIGSESYNIFPQTKIFIEYSRVNPFVYMNSVDAQLYSNDGFKMGHWIESNADVISFGVKKFFTSSLNAEVNAWYFRKGKTEEPIEQYSSPYPAFLYGSKRFEKGIELNLKYTPLMPVNLRMNYTYTDISDEESGRTTKFKLGKKHSFMLKLSYNL
ncbi:MAG: capsule assembly Wzi family protein [Ignavibacterium sp.]